LIVFGGIAAAIVIPNFIEALHKAKQKRTMADLRSVGVGLELYRAEYGGLPAIDSYDELEAILIPEPLAGVPPTDAWDNPFRYECTAPGGPTGCTSYRLASPGRDGEYELPSLAEYDPEPFGTSDYDRDIVYGDGVFVRYPDGS
jgi:general secretion pathway protein G